MHVRSAIINSEDVKDLTRFVPLRVQKKNICIVLHNIINF